MEQTRRIWVGWALASVLLAGCGRGASSGIDRKVEMRLVAAPGAEGQSVPTWSGEAPLTLEREVLVSGRDVQGVEMLPEAGSDRHFISLELSSAAGQRFEQVTASNVGRRLAVVVGDRVATAPVIKEKITGGKVAITARTEAEIQEMHRLLAG